MTTIIGILILCSIHPSSQENSCPTTLTGFVGEETVINCNFEPDFKGVFWFSDTSSNVPLRSLENGTENGRYSETNEFDIRQNGALVINYLQSKHEQRYRALLLDSSLRHYTFYVNVSVMENCPVTARGFYGSDAMINCRFGANVTHLYWFDSFNGKDFLISLVSGEKGGTGYHENEYDVMGNGSLVIKNVNFQHERNYEAVIVTSGKDEKFYVTFSVIEHCPPLQKGFIGEITYIVCHFKPDFNEVTWFDDLSSGQPMITRRGSEVYGPMNEKYTVTTNGSLRIPRVSDEHSNTYTIILRDAYNNLSTYSVDFVAEASCSVTSTPNNGHLSHVRKTITLAKVICNEGYHISVSNYSVCNGDQEIESDALFGSSPMCIPDDVTATRPTLPSDTTKMSLMTPTYKQNDDMGGSFAHEGCKKWQIVLIIESVLFFLSLVFNAVAILKLCSSINNTRSDEHQSTEEAHKLSTELGESSV